MPSHTETQVLERPQAPEIGVEMSLITRCLQGSAEAQRELYVRFAPKLMAVCMLYSKSHFDAEDLLQEGFIKIFTKLGSYQPIGSFEAWMRRIIVNIAIEQMRRNKRVVYTDQDLGPMAEAPTNNATLDGISQSEIMAMIGQLPEGYRTIFNLYVFEGLNHREIAEELGIAEGTSKSQFSRARTFLQRLITQSRKVALPRPAPQPTHGN